MFKENQIYSTTKYEDFNFKEENRNVDIAAAKRIAKIMAEKGWMGAPAEISISEGKLWIEDGQHRITAAKMTNTPVKFMIVPPQKASDVAQMNNLVKKWQTKDYIEMYARNGATNYKRLLNLINEFPEFTLREVSNAIGTHADKQCIPNGTFRLDDSKYFEARNTLMDARKLKMALESSGCKCRSYMPALIMLLRENALDVARMEDKIKKYGNQILIPVSTVNAAVDFLERLYNYHARDVVSLTHAYQVSRRKA